MRCEDIRDRLLDITSADLRSLDPDARAHLETCPDCRASAERSAGAWTLLNEIADEEPDSLAMRARFAATLARYERRSHFSWPRWQLAYGAAAAVIALAAGVGIGRQFPGDQADLQELSAMRQELGEVREMLTLSLMQQTVASERIKGVSSAGRMDDPPSDVVTALLDTLMHDPSVNVRLACVRALARLSERPAVRAGVVQAVAREPSPLVSIALIDFIVEAMDRMAVDALKQLAEDVDRDQAVRDTAARAIERLAGGGRI